MNGVRDDRLRGDLHDLAELARPVDLHDRVLVASRRARTRALVGGALAATLLVAAGVAVVLASPLGGEALPPADPNTPVILPEGEIQVWDPTWEPFDAGPLAHETLTLPPWPGAAGLCPSGPLTFIKDGAAPTEDGGSVHIVATTPADVDGDGETDHVALLQCYPQGGGGKPLFHFQVLAFSHVGDPSGVTTLGQVTASGVDGIVGIFGLEVSPGGTIRVEVGDGVASDAPTAQLQWREYAWQDTRFQQVGGATAFPADPPAVALAVTAGVSAATVDGQRYVTVTAAATNTGLPPVGPLRITLVVPVALKPVGAGWTGCVQDTGNVAEGQVVMQCPFPATLGAVDYRFRQDGQLGSAPIAYLGVEQGTPRLVERDLRDNQVELPLPA